MTGRALRRASLGNTLNARGPMRKESYFLPPGNPTSESNPFIQGGLVRIRAVFSESIKLRRLVYISGLMVALTAILVLFLEDQAFALLLGRAIGIFGVPVFFGLGWRYVWDDLDNPIRFLAYWSSAAQIVNLIANLVRVPRSSWGVSGAIMIAATAILVTIYVTGYFRRWLGNVATICLLTLNIVATYWLILNNLENVNLWMLGDYPEEGVSLLGGIVTDVCLLNPFASMAPQIFMLDLETRIREHEFFSGLMEAKGTVRNLTRIREKKGTQRHETPETVGVSRYNFIDFTRGVVMVIMAWDHIAGFWGKYKGGKMLIGEAPFLQTFAWFMSRFVTHYCAPAFIFISGAVLAISTAKRLGRGESQRAVSFRTVKRGLLLIVLQFFVVNGVWDKYGNYYSYLFGVIACIGACLILFSVIRRLPPNVVLALSLFIIHNHQFFSLNWIPDKVWWGHYLRVIIHEPNEFYWYPFYGRYPIIPWIGVMGVGWTFGQHLSRRKTSSLDDLIVPLVTIGFSAKALWAVVRFFNGYGNLRPRMDNSLWEWLWLAKYPPSVGFLLWSLGGMCLLMALGIYLERRFRTDRGVLGLTMTLGRTALFFYLTHLWLYRFRLPSMPPSDLKLELLPTVLAWLVGLLILWQLCIQYERLKKCHPTSILQYM